MVGLLPILKFLYNMEGRVIGLDVSTKTIGMALFSGEGKLLELKHITPKIKPKPKSKLEELFKKVDAFEVILTEYIKYDVERIVIEEPLLQSNNVYTVGTLLKFNGMISKVSAEVLNVIPDFISSYEARANAFPELMQIRTHNKKGEPYTEKELEKKNSVLFGGYPFDVDKKMVIWEKVSDLEPQIVWEYDKHHKLRKENFDMCDAYAAARGLMKKEGIW